MLGLKPIKMLPARERVAAALRKAIISRQIKEGEVLTLESTLRNWEYRSLRSEKLSRYWKETG